MKKTLTRILSVVLTAVMALTVLAACKGTENDPQQATPNPSGTTTAPSGDETTSKVETIPDPIDCKGYEFIILAKDNKLWFEMYANEAGAQTGDAISDALYTREVTIEEKYNCKIDLVKDSKADEKVKLNDQSGDGYHIADMLYTTGKLTLTLAQSGALRNVLNIPELQLSASYWDQNIQKEYKIGNALYCLEGDINIRDDLRTMQVTVNKSLYDKYNLEKTYGDIYSLVREYKWTYDTMLEMSKDLYSDPDDNGQSMADTYGIISEATAPYYMFLGSGLRAVENRDSKLVSCLDDPDLLEAVDKVMGLASNRSVAIINGGNIIGTQSVWDDAITLFVNDKGLFRTSALSSVNGYIDMKSDYGIIPVPMLYDNGDRYYCWVASGNHYPLSIPYEGIEDISMTATIIEAMAFYSKYLTTDNYNEAFYERLADYRLGKTADDVEMLDIIFASKTYELDQPLVVTGLENKMYTYAKQQYTDSFSSIISGLKGPAGIKADSLQKIYDSVAKLEG